MKNIKNYILLFALLMAFVGCDDFFEEDFNNNLSEETVFDYHLNPEYVAGLYVPAYGAVSNSYTTLNNNFLDCVTDNAVTNDYDATPWKMRTVNDFITSSNYPIYIWGRNYRYIKDIYKFLSVGLNDDIVYRTSSELRSEQIKERMGGEAHFLLALNYFQLLRDYAGPVEGRIMGVPIVDKDISAEEARNISRDTYDDCVDFIVAHIDTALNSGLLPEYSNDYLKDHPGLDPTIYGDIALGIPTTTACYSLKSRLYLYAASPAFSIGKSDAEIQALYTKAAEAAKMVIDQVGTLSKESYNLSDIDDYYTKVDNNPELILRRASQTTDWEKNNYPPSIHLSVLGRTNPSQNLVDVFPMANGYPIHEGLSGYDANDPYTGRDPRFYMTVIYNNASFKNQKIEMWPGGNNTIEGNDQIADDARISRTNYYLRKHITEIPNFAAQSTTKPWHYTAAFRAVEAYLNFAEAANAAVGPDGMISGLSAREP
ncbi:RagB/SusD family nutrient uptake outer membrane protein [Saccharicrinis fermentans]|uniref:SusD family protein n=1 Tax=Saccharicrinis fermentans DSM 9555 = JCM 21142 TaxID=869213 RepID=W7YE86_9BACT|nr:RagB/SusD family nutrient uptake outer membrane protein [Saccharicrinis fermentans]GAF02776.1 SusD family protein [Saccharicrinis fermentans DSM 9555 = JCM 21142]